MFPNNNIPPNNPFLPQAAAQPLVENNAAGAAAANPAAQPAGAPAQAAAALAANFPQGLPPGGPAPQVPQPNLQQAPAQADPLAAFLLNIAPVLAPNPMAVQPLPPAPFAQGLNTPDSQASTQTPFNPPSS
jgi:hypothetical protein